MMINLLFTALEAWDMHGVPMSLHGWPVESDVGSPVAGADVASGSSPRGKARSRTLESDPKNNQAPPFDKLRQILACCGSAAGPPALAILVITVLKDRESTKPHIHCYNEGAAGETCSLRLIVFNRTRLKTKARVITTGVHWLRLTHFDKRARNNMAFMRPYTAKERYKIAKHLRRSRPDYDARTEWINHGQDALENDLRIEGEKRGLNRRGMDPDFSWASNHLRMAKAVRENVNKGIEVGGRAHAVFFTFTFRHIPWDQCQFKYANDCFRKASRTFLPRFFKHWCRVLDVDEKGKPHLHGIGITHEPIFDGFDGEAYDSYVEASRINSKIKKLRKLRDTVSTNANLRAIWSELDSNMGKFGFGPLHGVFPIRHFPDKLAGCFRTQAAEYLVRAYYGAVPAIKRTSPLKIRSFQTSAKYPYKKRAKDIVSDWWKKSIKPLVGVFDFDDAKQFAALLDRYWGLAILNLIDGLDAFTGRNILDQGWREFSLNDKAWLARKLKWMIEHDQFLHDQACGLLRHLTKCAANYHPNPNEPPSWRWESLIPRSCTCCPGRQPVHASVVHSIMAVPN